MPPRPPSKNEKKRLALELSTAARDNLDELQVMTDADSLAEVIRRSLNLYRLVVSAKQSGSSLIIRTKEGSKVKDVEVELM